MYSNFPHVDASLSKIGSSTEDETTNITVNLGNKPEVNKGRYFSFARTFETARAEFWKASFRFFPKALNFISAVCGRNLYFIKKERKEDIKMLQRNNCLIVFNNIINNCDINEHEELMEQSIEKLASGASQL